MTKPKWGYKPKAEYAKAERRCECTRLATIRRNNYFICTRCAGIESDLHANRDSFAPQQHQRPTSHVLEACAVHVGARGRAHLPFDMEAA